MERAEKRIYILGAGVMQLPAIRIAKGFGWEVVCADGNTRAAGRDEVDYFENIDLKERDAIADSVVAWRKGRGLDGVFTAGTDFSAVVAYAAEQAELPGIPYRNALMATDKVLMRRAFDAAGVPSPRFHEVYSLDEGMALLDDLELPAVVKPVDNMGARGIRRVGRPSEYRSALKEAFDNSRSGRAIVEAYLDGPEFSLDALIYKGRFTLCGIADRHIRFAPYFVEIGHTMPAAIDEERRRQVVDLFRRGAAALGIENGAAKGDIKLTSDGAVAGEIAARLSGGYMSGWTFPLSSGVEVTAGALKIAVGEDPGDLTPSRQYTSAERAFFSVPGRLAGVSGFATDGVDAGFLSVAAGETVTFPTNNVQKCGNFIYSAPGREEASLRAEEACRRVLLRLEAGDKSTYRFLARLDFSWVPDAFVLSEPGNIEFLETLSTLPDHDDIKERGMIIQALPVAEADAKDWLGRTLQESLRLTGELAEVAVEPAQGNIGRLFWRALLRGGYQGGVWYIDTVRAWLKTGSFSEILEDW